MDDERALMSDEKNLMFGIVFIFILIDWFVGWLVGWLYHDINDVLCCDVLCCAVLRCDAICICTAGTGWNLSCATPHSGQSF